jgi:hypothetical protein
VFDDRAGVNETFWAVLKTIPGAVPIGTGILY